MTIKLPAILGKISIKIRKNNLKFVTTQKLRNKNSLFSFFPNINNNYTKILMCTMPKNYVTKNSLTDKTPK